MIVTKDLLIIIVNYLTMSKKPNKKQSKPIDVYKSGGDYGVVSPKEVYKSGGLYGVVSPKDVYKSGGFYGIVSTKDF